MNSFTVLSSSNILTRILEKLTCLTLLMAVSRLQKENGFWTAQTPRSQPFLSYTYWVVFFD